MRKYILTILIAISALGHLIGQYHAILNHDNIPLESDSLKLTIDAQFDNVQWQISYDTINWFDIKKSDELEIKIFSPIQYRAIVSINTCNPVFSDTIYLYKDPVDIPSLTTLFESSETTKYPLAEDGETIIEHQLNEDIDVRFTFPDKVLTRPAIDTINMITLASITDMPDGISFIGAVHLLPDGLQFIKPVEIKISIPETYSIDELLPFQYLSDDNLFYPLGIHEIVGPENGYFTIVTKINHFSGIGLGEGSGKSCNQYAIFNTSDDYVAYFSCVFEEAGETTDEVIYQLKPLYEEWYDDIVKTSIEDASTLSELDDAMSEFYDWYTDGFYRFFEDEYDQLYDWAVEKMGIVLLNLTNAIDASCSQSSDVCNTKNYLDSYYELYTFYVNSELYGTIDGFPEEDEFCGNAVESVVNSIQISPAAIKIKKDEEASIEVICKSFQNVTIDDPGLIWQVGDNSIASLGGGLTVRGLKSGKTTITATYCNIVKTISVTVYEYPIVTTSFYKGLNGESVIYGGVVEEDWDVPIVERGVILNGEEIKMGEGLGEFLNEKFDLSSNETYFIQAYAINEDDAISYGKERGWLTDVEKNIYPIVKIGDQWWMAENLNNSSIESSCFLDKSEYCATYGRLYSWNAALNSCPTGWHLPSDSEFTVLVESLGGVEVAGAKLIEVDTELWQKDITGATNESGLSVLPGGYGAISNYGTLMWVGVGLSAYFWSSTECDSEDSWFRVIYGVNDLGREDFRKTSRFSVRCVMNL